MRRKNYKIRQFALNGAKINCASFSKKILAEDLQESGLQERHEYFVTGDTHNNVRFYEFSGEQQLNCFSGSSSTVQAQVSAVAISWEEKNIFSGSNRGIINIWDVLSTKTSPSYTLRGHATSVNCFGLFPQQQNRIASGSYDTHIKLWDLRQRNNIGVLKHHTKQINSIDVSPDCHYLISGSEDSSVKLWDMRYPQKVICTYSEHSAPILKVKFNPQDCMFVSSSMDRTAKYFRCEMNHYDYISTTQLVSMPITAIDFNPDGSKICTAGNDILKIWNMNKNGILTETLDSAWKGVQDVLWSQKGIKGIASHGGYLSTWFCYLDGNQSQHNQQQIRENESKLPKIHRNPSIKRQQSEQNPIQNNSRNSRNSNSRQMSREAKQVPEKDEQKNKQLQQVMNNIQFAINMVNNIDENKLTKQQEQKKLEAQKRKQELRQKAKLFEEERREKLRIQKQKEKQQKQRKQRQRQQKIKKQRQQEQKIKQQRLEAMAKERSQRQRILQQRLHQTFQRNNDKNLEVTLEPDVLEHSSVMNLSTFMGDGLQKQKLMQIQQIGDFMKDSGKYESVYMLRSKNVKPILHLWKSGKIQSAINTLQRADLPIAVDTIGAILHNNTFKFGVTPEVACAFIRKLIQIMHNKHLIYVKNSMTFLNEIVLMFKEQLIKVKNFNPLTRVDLSRQERMAKYDRLTEQFLNVFKDERVKKYSQLNKDAQDNQKKSLYLIAHQLYKNLEQILRKIMPRKQPEAA